MKTYRLRETLTLGLPLILHLCLASPTQAQTVSPPIPKFALRKSGLELERRTQAG